MKFQRLIFRSKKLIQVIRFPRMLKALVAHGVFGGAEHRRNLSQNLVFVVDIGANCGQFALAVRQWAPNARIISFEPLSKPADRFRQVFKADINVTLHQVAIGPHSGTAPIHVSASDDSSSLLPISELQTQIFPGTEEVGREEVQVCRLSDCIAAEEIEGPAMLKLDVQGFELKALRGCDELLERFSHVYVECSFVELYEGQALVDEIIAWLRERGFRLAGAYNLSYDKRGRPVQGDFLFANIGGSIQENNLPSHEKPSSSKD